MKKTVIVTGATRGIGFDIAKYLVDQDYSVILCGSNSQSVEALREADFVRLAGATVLAVDLADPSSVSGFVQKIGALKLWGIVNNAGICKTMNLLDEGDDPLQSILATNLIGPYQLTKALLPNLNRPGRIVNIASQLGVEGRAGYSAYCASKFGLVGMTKCWAKELGGAGITVNAVCPGWVDTEMSKIDMHRLASEAGIAVEAYYAQICQPLELRRFNSTNEVAALVAFLLSEAAAGITGRDWLMQTVWNQQ